MLHIRTGTPAHERLLICFDQAAARHLLQETEREYAGQGQHRRVMLQAQLDQLLFLTTRAAAAMPAADDGSRTSPILPKAAEIIGLLNSRFAVRITLSAAASLAGFSASRASRMFKRGDRFLLRGILKPHPGPQGVAAPS